MRVIPFTRPPHDHVMLHLQLAKGERRRRFWVRALAYRPGTWKGQIWFDGRTHRQVVTTELHEILTFRIQCEAEVRELEKDGWRRIAATPPGRRP
jgi:hypothetical protein